MVFGVRDPVSGLKIVSSINWISDISSFCHE